MYEHDAQAGGHEPPPAADAHVVPLTDVIDVDRYGRVRADPVLLHQSYHLEDNE